MRRIRPGAALAGLALLGAVTLTSCTSVRNSLGPRESSCFRVLPAAELAVRGEGRYSGLKYVSPQVLVSALHRSRPHRQVMNVPTSLLTLKSPTCLVEFHGNFDVRKVEDGWSPLGGMSGKYAVVVVRQSDSRVIATAVLPKDPLRFGRTYPSLR